MLKYALPLTALALFTGLEHETGDLPALHPRDAEGDMAPGAQAFREQAEEAFLRFEQHVVAQGRNPRKTYDELRRVLTMGERK